MLLDKILPRLLMGIGLLLPGCSTLGGAPIGEVVELLAEGGEKRLRKPLRPVRGTQRLLIFALDGVGNDDLKRAIRQGRMPQVTQLLGAADAPGGVFPHGYVVPEGMLTVLPTATTAAWVALFTGRPPAETGVLGDEWFVRDRMQFFAPVPVSVSGRSHAVKQYTDNLLGKIVEVPTLYEQVNLRAHVGMSPVYDGADLLTLPDLAKLGDLFGAVAEGALGEGMHTAAVFHETDESAVQSVLESIAHEGIPDIQTVYLPGVDLFTHYTEQAVEAQQEYLGKTVDPLIGRVLRAYRERGVLDSTYVVLLADHGHTAVLPDDRHALETSGDDEPAQLFRHVGFRVRPFKISPHEKDYQAVLAYQGGMAFVYLADRGTCPRPRQRCEWSRPPRWEQDVLPVLNALHAANHSGAVVPALQGTLDLILARPRGAPEGAFQVWNGDRLLPVADFLRLQPRPDLPRLEERLKQLAVGPHGRDAGDILLITKSGADRPLEDRFYFSRARLYSDHGGPGVRESAVPLIVAHPRSSGSALRKQVHDVMGESPSVLQAVSLFTVLLGAP